ncbi:MAG: FAD-dependent oxidoreductase [Nitrospirae bacterium]|nr:FAD-dependent oxidoreductase [Nitrospirota bacterium]
MSKYDIVIIGAGISGLSLAHYCAREGFKTIVVEKSERVGGTLHSERFEDIGFWIEMGAHTCYNSYRNLIGIMEDSAFIDKLIPREKVPFKMLVDHKIKFIPSQLDFLELLLSVPRIFGLKKEGQSVGSYYSKILGNKNFDCVLSPALNAVISQDASDFPVDMLFKKRPRRKDIMKKFTLTNGIQTITDLISSQKNIEIATSKMVISIEHDGVIFKTATDSEIYESESLAIAAPAYVAAQLLGENFPELSKDLSQIKVESVESVGIAVKKDLTASIPPVAGIIPSSDSFYSVVSRDMVKHELYRGFTFHFKPGILNNDAKLKRIAEVLRIKTAQIEHMAAKENFVPSLKVGHEVLINKIEQSISSNRLFLTGNYFDGMAIEDCVTRSLKEFTRLKNMMGHS